MIEAIVYSSNTGSTARYAEMLGKKLNLPVQELKGAKLKRGAEIIYLGWLMAGGVKGYKAAARKYKPVAVCAVGMGMTGSIQDEVRVKNAIPRETALFTLQGNFDMAKLRGIHRMLMGAILKNLQKADQRTPEQNAMLQFLTSGADYVREENLAAVLKWHRDMKK